METKYLDKKISGYTKLDEKGKLSDSGKELLKELEAIKQALSLDIVVGSSQLKVGDKIKLPSGLEAEVIKTKIKVKDSFGGEYYLSDIEVG